MIELLHHQQRSTNMGWMELTAYIEGSSLRGIKEVAGRNADVLTFTGLQYDLGLKFCGAVGPTD